MYDLLQQYNGPLIPQLTPCGCIGYLFDNLGITPSHDWLQHRFACSQCHSGLAQPLPTSITKHPASTTNWVANYLALLPRMASKGGIFLPSFRFDSINHPGTIIQKTLISLDFTTPWEDSDGVPTLAAIVALDVIRLLDYRHQGSNSSFNCRVFSEEYIPKSHPVVLLKADSIAISFMIPLLGKDGSSHSHLRLIPHHTRRRFTKIGGMLRYLNLVKSRTESLHLAFTTDVRGCDNNFTTTPYFDTPALLDVTRCCANTLTQMWLEKLPLTEATILEQVFSSVPLLEFIRIEEFTMSSSTQLQETIVGTDSHIFIDPLEVLFRHAVYGPPNSLSMLVGVEYTAGYTIKEPGMPRMMECLQFLTGIVDRKRDVFNLRLDAPWIEGEMISHKKSVIAKTLQGRGPM